MEFPKNNNIPPKPFSILDKGIPTSEYCPIDLSIENRELDNVALANAVDCQRYVTKVLIREGAKVAYGGYLEKRDLYNRSERFQGNEPRNLHLGMDFWCAAGTSVTVPLDGTVHSFSNNVDFGNYGPTIILSHTINGHGFHTLYGHLSLASLEGLYKGKKMNMGTVLATLGTPDINVGYAPHLHFQLILDMGNYQGDYPGVCSENDLDYFKNNCPDPNLLLGFDR